jgi:alpha-N-arabinofuranosidase
MTPGHATRASRRPAGTTLVVLALSALVPTSATVPANAASERTDHRRRAETALLRINAHRLGAPVSPLLAGANHRYSYNGYGIWNDEKQRPTQPIVRRVRQAGISLVRYPGGSQANLFDWKQAIGPVSERGCQVNGRWGNEPLRAEYGVDEHMLVADRMGTQTHVTIPFPTETPQDAGALVEYMNARVGQDPDGDGVDWAAERRKNQRRLGVPVGPYNIKRWSIGNEPYLRNQRFWMSANAHKAMQQYINGGRQRYTDQLVGRLCRRSETMSSGTGQPEQRFEVLYPPVEPNSQRITVDGEVWTEVDSLDPVALPTNDKVYTFNDDTGAIHFGDGTNGAVPPQGAPVRASYTGMHGGFVDFARAMHRVDPTIDVCSEWGTAPFAQAMARARQGYDCLAAHPYSFMFRQWRTALEAHDNHMLGLRARIDRLHKVQAAVRKLTNGRSYVAVTEYGGIALEPQPYYRAWESSMTDALYMMSSLSGIMNAGVPWAEGGALTSGSLRSWIGPAPHYTVTSAARALSAVRSMVHGGGRVVHHSLRGPQQRSSYSRQRYDALAASVTRDREGALNVLLINRDPNDVVRVEVRNPRFRGSHSARVWRVTSARISSANTPSTPNAVRLVTGKRRVSDPQHFVVPVPAHSMLRLRTNARR